MNREDLEYDISIALDRWDNKSDFTLAGVGNLSRADLDTLLVCCEYHDEHGHMMTPNFLSDHIKEVLVHYGML